jgi:hypothetical protein
LPTPDEDRRASAVASQKAGRGKKKFDHPKTFLPTVPNLIIFTLVHHISDNTNTMIIFTSEIFIIIMEGTK